MPTILLGNVTPVATMKDERTGEVLLSPLVLPEGQVPAPTVVRVPDDWTFAETIGSITAPGNGIVARHFQAGTGPTWVAADSPVLASAHAAQYGVEVHEMDI